MAKKAKTEAKPKRVYAGKGGNDRVLKGTKFTLTRENEVVIDYAPLLEGLSEEEQAEWAVKLAVLDGEDYSAGLGMSMGDGKLAHGHDYEATPSQAREIQPWSLPTNKYKQGVDPADVWCPHCQRFFRRTIVKKRCSRCQWLPEPPGKATPAPALIPDRSEERTEIESAFAEDTTDESAWRDYKRTAAVGDVQEEAERRYSGSTRRYDPGLATDDDRKDTKPRSVEWDATGADDPDEVNDN